MFLNKVDESHKKVAEYQLSVFNTTSTVVKQKTS